MASSIFRVKNPKDGKVIGRSPLSCITCDEFFGEKEETITRVEDILDNNDIIVGSQERRNRYVQQAFFLSSSCRPLWIHCT